MNMGIKQRVQRAFGVLSIALFAAFSTQSTASAHTELVSSAPAANESVNSAPTTISLTFSEAPLLEGSAILVTDSTGAAVATGPVALNGVVLSVAWPAGLQPGTVKVAWRTVADDGHPASGDFTFEYTAAVESGAVASASPDISASSNLVVATPLAATVGGLAQDEPSESGNGTRLILIGMIVVIGVGIGIYLTQRNK
ncbi:MAG: copper resistance CopC family protein [Actinomycetes bacterium]